MIVGAYAAMPTSLLTEDRVRGFIVAGGGREDYRGVKIQVQAGADVETRAAMIRRLSAMC